MHDESKQMINSAAKSVTPQPEFEVRLATDDAEKIAAQRLRYRVFVEEMGADGPLVDHVERLERDRFDPHADQLILLDKSRSAQDQIIGVYRVMDSDAARAAGQFYSESEYDLNALRTSGRTLLELGRSCVHPDYRGGLAMVHLWQGLAKIVRDRNADVLFGVASLKGTDPMALAQPLSVLARDHLAPADLRVVSKHYQDMALSNEIDRLVAMKQMPSLIKAYLRLGGFVGDGAFVDHAFNTIDVCLILDIARMNPKQRAIYGGDI